MLFEDTASCMYCCSESGAEKESASEVPEVDERQQLMAEVDERKRKILREVEVSTQPPKILCRLVWG